MSVSSCDAVQYVWIWLAVRVGRTGNLCVVRCGVMQAAGR